MMDGFGGHGWGMGWWWIIGIILIVLVIWMAAKAMNQNKGSGPRNEKSALDILNERYARGEIDKKEYEERKKNLM